jgi:hypothetical protein
MDEFSQIWRSGIMALRNYENEGMELETNLLGPPFSLDLLSPPS